MEKKDKAQQHPGNNRKSNCADSRSNCQSEQLLLLQPCCNKADSHTHPHSAQTQHTTSDDVNVLEHRLYICRFHAGTRRSAVYNQLQGAILLSLRPPGGSPAFILPTPAMAGRPGWPARRLVQWFCQRWCACSCTCILQSPLCPHIDYE